MQHVIRRTDQGGGWVADMALHGQKSSYTRDLTRARLFDSRDHADSERCPDNEVAESLADATNCRRSMRVYING